MAFLHQFDYIFAFGVIFAFLDAWNIGANDVANSFATSVSSRSLTLLQAMCIAAVMELGGSIGVGGRVADTIRTKVVDPKLFSNDPAVLMLGMVCALVGSSLYLTFATRIGLPVSTTHSIMGGVIGMGFGSVGGKRVSWGWKGVASVFATWAIAPGLAGIFAALIFLITKYSVLRRKNAPMAAIVTVPIYFALTTGLITMLIVWKGAAARVAPTTGQILGSIFGVAFGVALVVSVFFLPYLYRKIVQGDWTLKPWEAIYGPLLLRRGPVPERPEGVAEIQDYYRGHMTREQFLERDSHTDDVERTRAMEKATEKGADLEPSSPRPADSPTMPLTKDDQPHDQAGVYIGPRPSGGKFAPMVLLWWAKRIFFHGINKDVVNAQKKRSILSRDIDQVHARAERYDNKAEYVYSFLQILTASAASFTHGANDVANAIGPFATIYQIWSTGRVPSKSPVPIWILAFGGGAIVIGLWTYGYNIMRSLGNRITLHSPSRGFSMELGAAITVIMATRLAIPVSTTQCIAGATVGVGLCNGDWRSINWRMVAWIYFGWFVTLPVTALISGCLLSIILNAPQFGRST